MKPARPKPTRWSSRSVSILARLGFADPYANER
jgi:hypothetical protein